MVTANCGYALAPVESEEARQYLVAAMSTVEQIPEVSIETGVPFDWSDLPSYAARLDALDVLLNHAFLIGHVPIRAAVLGVPGAYSRQATADEIVAMGRLLRQGTELGALGFSTDQVIGNPGPGGTALPGQVCGEDELLALAAVLGAGPRTGPVHHGQCRAPAGARGAGGRPGLAPAPGGGLGPAGGGRDRSSTRREDPGGAFVLMDMALAGQRADKNVVPQISTRPFELWTRLDSPGTLVRSLPSLMAAVQDAGAAGVRALAADPEARAQLRREGAVMPPNPGLQRALGPCPVALLPPTRRRGEGPGCAQRRTGDRSRPISCSTWRWPTTSRPRWQRSCATATTTRWRAWWRIPPP